MTEIIEAEAPDRIRLDKGTKEAEEVTRQELEQMVYAEEERLGVGSAEFMQRHHEMMEQCSSLLMEGEKKSRKYMLEKILGSD